LKLTGKNSQKWVNLAQFTAFLNDLRFILAFFAFLKSYIILCAFQRSTRA